MVKTLFATLTKPLIGSGLGWSKFLWNIYCYMGKTLANPGKIIAVHGFKMYTDTCDELPSLVVSGEYEEFNTKIFSRFIKKDTVVVDIGAHVGYFSLLSASLGARVYAFEPEDSHFEYLVRNITLNGFNILPIKRAVSDVVSETPLYASHYHGAGFTLYPKSKNDHQTDVKTVSIDQCFKEMSMAVDLIKIDIEGMEVYALRGMKEVVSRKDDVKVLMEFSPAYLRKASTSPAELWDVLGELGLNYVYMLDEKCGVMRIRSCAELMENRKLGVFGRDIGASLLCSKKEMDFAGD